MPGTSSGRHGEPRRSLLVWCQGPRPGEDSDSAHSSSTTTPPPRRRPPSRPLPRDSISLSSPSSTTQYTVIFIPVRLFHLFRSRMQPKSATSLNHHNRLNSPDHTTYLRMCNIHVHRRVDEPEVSHAQDKHSLFPSKTRSSKSDSDAARPRIGLTSPFIRGTTFPAIFPSTHHLALHCGTAYKLG